MTSSQRFFSYTGCKDSKSMLIGSNWQTSPVFQKLVVQVECEHTSSRHAEQTAINLRFHDSSRTVLVNRANPLPALNQSMPRVQRFIDLSSLRKFKIYRIAIATCSRQVLSLPPATHGSERLASNSKLTIAELMYRAGNFLFRLSPLKHSMSRMRKAFCLATFISLSGCSALDFTKAKPQSADDVFDFSAEQFSIQAVGTDKPNDIVASIQIPKQLISSSVLRRTTQSTDHHEMIDISASGNLTDIHLKPKETYSYELGFIKDGAFVPTISRSLTIPEDLVVTGRMKLSGQSGATLTPFRVFIRDHGMLLTDGQSLKIETTEIISENGTIETFSESDQAALNRRGAHGGRLEVIAEKLKGQLQIVMRGQRGGSGTPGEQGDACTAGIKGAEGGNSGILHLRIKSFNPADLHIITLAGQGGPGGDGGKCWGGQVQYAPSGTAGDDGEIEEQDFTQK